MIKADCHIHTDFSTDSTTPMEVMIEKAISIGLSYICITDHMDFDYPGTKIDDFIFKPDNYYETVHKLTSKYKEKIQVLFGIEIGLQPYLKERYDILLSQYPFDFVIGSSHLVDGLDPYFNVFWQDKTDHVGLTKYFQSIIDNMNSNPNIDVYGHLDYIIRYVPSKITRYEYTTYQAIIDELLLAIIEKGKGIEVNTSGYKYGLDHAHPKEEIIKRYFELGGSIITIGSDAHKPEHLAYDFERARNMLLSLGISQYAIFKERKPQFLPL